MPDWETYKGVEVPDADPTGVAGLKLKDDLLLLADRMIAGVCQGRLTLESGVPVSTTDQTAKTTVYFTPFDGNQVGLYDGTTWGLHEFTERSVSVPSTTDTPFDVFLYDNSGTLTLETVDWANATTRATALTRQSGVLVKSGATDRLYLGTCCTRSTSGQCEDSIQYRYVWNYFNRVIRRTYVTDGTDHTYSGGSWRAWNNSTSIRIYFVLGAIQDALTFMLVGEQEDGAFVGLGLDSTTLGYGVIARNNFSGRMRIGAAGNDSPASQGTATAIGAHYIQVLEWGDDVATTFRTVSLYINILG